MEREWYVVCLSLEVAGSALLAHFVPMPLRTALEESQRLQRIMPGDRSWRYFPVREGELGLFGLKVE